MSFDAYDLLWLLLPLAVGSGWLAAKFDQKRQAAANDLPTAYFKGLNFLLNEQPDKAIEVFIQALEVNSETVETHLALGNLFRRRGEVERAIRIHQNLIARPTLDKQQRSQALLELGQDYLKAGLFDRAENLFLELAEIRLHNEQALRFLRQIYQQEREWHNAISVCRKLTRLSGKNFNDVIGQYYCELAEEALTGKNVSQARDLLKKALTSDPGCVRASILLGSLEAEEGRHDEALKAWRRIEEQDARYLGEVAGRLRQSFQSLGDNGGMYEFLQRAMARHNSAALMLTFIDVLEQREGKAAAQAFLTDWLRRRPSIHGLHRLTQLKLADAEDAEQEGLRLLQGIIERLLDEHHDYVCRICGFKGKSLHWQCPGCNRWNTIRPETGEAIG